MQIAINPPLLSIGEAAAYLRISRAKFYADILPILESVRIGGRRLVYRDSLDKFIAAQRQKVA